MYIGSPHHACGRELNRGCSPGARDPPGRCSWVVDPAHSQPHRRKRKRTGRRLLHSGFDLHCRGRRQRGRRHGRAGGRAVGRARLGNPAESAGYSLAGVSCKSSTACSSSRARRIPVERRRLVDPAHPKLREWQRRTERCVVHSGRYLHRSWHAHNLCETHFPDLDPSGAVERQHLVDQSTPNPTSYSGSALEGVSYTSANACTAVGHGINSTLAERWDGTAWTIQPTPPPPGAAGETVLSDVSCTTATTCTAVGFYTNASGGYVTLGEQRCRLRFEVVAFRVRACSRTASRLAISPARRPRERRTARREAAQHSPPHRRKRGWRRGEHDRRSA